MAVDISWHRRSKCLLIAPWPHRPTPAEVEPLRLVRRLALHHCAGAACTEWCAPCCSLNLRPRPAYLPACVLLFTGGRGGRHCCSTQCYTAKPSLLPRPREGLLLAREGETRETYSDRIDKNRGLINKRLFVLIHACFQVPEICAGQRQRARPYGTGR